MTERNYALQIAEELHLTEEQVKNTLALLEGGATIPFISRYRKEATGSLDEVQIGQIRDLHLRYVELDKRRAAIIDSVSEQGKLTPELEAQFNAALTLSELEDLYLPYRPKRKTRATVAVEKGLEPLAKLISTQRQVDLEKEAAHYVNEEKGVQTVDEALAGARDILAERISENITIRARLRNTFRQHSTITTKRIKDKVDEEEKYRIYYDAHEKLARAPSHRVLAMLRGEEEGILRLTIAPDEQRTLESLKKWLIHSNTNCAQQMWIAATDAYKRLLQPQLETEMRNFYKEKADTEAISVFTQNLRQLLLAAPLGQVTTLAIDPGFRTGCKVVILDPQGKLLHNETIYPHPPVAQYKLASDKLKRLVLQYKVDAIAIGNGTAGRETENFIRYIPFEREVKAYMVNESGASVYSASPVARAEFPDYDVTVRGAVSIGRRLMDPLAELVKIDPKSIGVGQYQHDVNQKRLQESLEQTVESCVNYVGVELNTASKELLSYVSGIGPSLARNIIDYRNEHGPFPSRESLKQVPRFGATAFEQSAARPQCRAPRKLSCGKSYGRGDELFCGRPHPPQGDSRQHQSRPFHHAQGGVAHADRHNEGVGQAGARPPHAVREVRVRQECAQNRGPAARDGAAWHRHQHHQFRLLCRYRRSPGRPRARQQSLRQACRQPWRGGAPQPESDGPRGRRGN